MGVSTRGGNLYSGCKLGCIFLECIFGEVYIRERGGGGGGVTGFRTFFILKKKSLFFLDSQNKNSDSFYRNKCQSLLYSHKTEIVVHFIKKIMFFIFSQYRNSGSLYEKDPNFFHILPKQNFCSTL